MTTSNFLKQSISVSRGLKERDIHPGDLVIILGNNSLNLNVTMIGILFSGAIAVPVSHVTNPGGFKFFLIPPFFNFLIYFFFLRRFKDHFGIP